MAGLSNYAEQQVLDWLFNTGTPTRPSTYYLGLFTTTPTDSTAGVEVSASGYTRTLLTLRRAAGESRVTNRNVLELSAAIADWGTIRAFGIFDALSGGNLLVYGTLLASLDTSVFPSIPGPAADAALTVGDIFRIGFGDFAVEID